MVTHDRYFLDQITNAIVELANGRFYSYTGNYTDYLDAKANARPPTNRSRKRARHFLRRELEWVRSGVQARRTKTKDRFERYYEVAAQSGPNVESDIDLVIPPPPQLGNRVVELTKVGIELGGRRTLFRPRPRIRSRRPHRRRRPQRLGQNNPAQNYPRPIADPPKAL